jgi:ABC-type phosphate transport system permease subunit
MSSAVVGVVAAWFVLRDRAKQDESMAYAVAILTTILISYHFHMQDLSMVLLPVLVLTDQALRQWYQRGSTGDGLGGTQSSTIWTVVLAVTIVALYLYRIAAEPFPILVVRGCLLAVPLFVLWIVALRWWCVTPHSKMEGQ